MMSFHKICLPVLVSVLICSMGVQAEELKQVYPDDVKVIIVEKDVEEVPQIKAAGLERFQVESGNPYYKEADGVLFSKGYGLWPLDELILYPSSKAEKDYVMPGKVRDVGAYAFRECRNLESVVVSSQVEEMSCSTFYRCPKLKSVFIPSSVKRFEKDTKDSVDWGKKVVIYCEKGSEAEWFAKKNGIKYKSYTRPSRVTGLKAKVKNQDEVTLSWRAVAGASGYDIYGQRSNRDELELLASVSGKYHTTWTEKLGTTSSGYEVRAYRAAGKGKIRGKASKTVKAVTDKATFMSDTIIVPTLLKDEFREEGMDVFSCSLTIPAGQEEIIVPVKMSKKGSLHLEMSLKQGDVSSVGIGIYKDKQCTDGRTVFWTGRGMASNNQYVTGREWMSKKGTCYLLLSKKKVELTDQDVTVNLRAYFYNTEDRTLKSGQWVVTETTNLSVVKDKMPYFKIEISQKGYIRLEGENVEGKNTNLSFSLYDADKKKLKKVSTCADSPNGVEGYIAVEKGTYYLQQLRYKDAFRFRYTFCKNPNGKNFTKDKALSMKNGKVYKGVFYAEDGKGACTRWYKVELAKTQKLTLAVYERDAKIMIYDSAGKKVPSGYEQKYGAENYLTDDYSTKEKVKKGTYYIRITHNAYKYTGKTMGEYYSLQWKSGK